MKKRIGLLLMAAVLGLSLAACGKKKEEAQEPAVPDNVMVDLVPDTLYTEELPAQNALDPANPIPPDTGTLELEEYESPLAFVKLLLPSGVSVTEGEVDSYGNGHVYIKDDYGEWVIELRPMHASSDDLPATVHGLNSNPQQDNGTDSKVDWSKDISGTFAGFPAHFWANNIQGYVAKSDDNGRPAVVIWLDYGETISGPWYGLQIRVEAQNPTSDTNIYEILYRRAVRAVLNNLTVIETGEGITYESNGFSVTLPSRFQVMGDGVIVATIRSEQYDGALMFATDPGSDPEEAAASKDGEPFTKTYGGRTWNANFEEREKKDEEGNLMDPEYIVYFYAPYSDKRIQKASVHFNGYTKEDYETFFDSEMFTDIMASVTQDPSAWQDPSLLSADGFSAYKNGTLMNYEGAGGDIEIPAEIGDVAVTGISGFQNNASITSVVIPEGANYILPDAFRDCPNLKKVVIPSSVNAIGNNAFRNCPALETVEFASGLKEIGYSAFCECPSLRDVSLPDTVTSVESRVFYESGKGSFEGPGAVYGEGCFNWAGFTSITIADGADLSEPYLFTASEVEEINLPADLTVVGDFAFSYCTNLKSLVLPDTVTTLGDRPFDSMALGEIFHVNIPDSLTEIPENCFEGTTLDIVFLPEGVKKIGAHALSARVLFLGNSDIELADYALNVGALGLVGIYTPEDMPKNLGNQYAFSSVNLPMDATMAESEAMDAYLVSIGQEAVSWIGTQPELYPSDFSEYRQSKHWLTGYTGDSDTLSIPFYGEDLYNDTSWIEERAFAGNTKIKTVYLNGVNTIHAHAFDGCTGIKDVWVTSATTSFLDNAEAMVPECFAGMPENMTVHTPERWSDSELAHAKEQLLKLGMPQSTTFVSYSFR